MSEPDRPYSKHGCCADRCARDRDAAEGRSTVGYVVCDDRTCMELPEGETCATCVHTDRCCTVFGAEPENTYCGFFPRRFRLRIAQ